MDCIDNCITNPVCTPADNNDDISNGNGDNHDEIPLSSCIGVCSNLIDQGEEANNTAWESIANCITNPDWTPADNNDDIPDGNGIDENFVQQQFIVIGTECFLSNEISIENECLQLNDEEGLPSPNNECIDNPLADPDWTPDGDDNISIENECLQLNDEEGLPSPNNECIDKPLADPDWTPDGDDNISDDDGDNNDEIISSSSCLGDLTNKREFGVDETINTTNSGDRKSKGDRKRWSRADPNIRDRSIQKKRRNTGQDYQVKEKHFSAKSPKESCNIKCRYKCSNNFNEEERRKNCAEYWALETNLTYYPMDLAAVYKRLLNIKDEELKAFEGHIYNVLGISYEHFMFDFDHYTSGKASNFTRSEKWRI
ncbi:uncharacterized protein LOC120351082 [Nilaparvata lugens]|uniref:uncharacterized protein LOC120351082 n=1 Tax=Nilaparvata lugens TaxID=108931 RepID=UPI00193EA94A|nr:uncharacterized protein LOC120351082 [Nilaparvata lugens]